MSCTLSWGGTAGAARGPSPPGTPSGEESASRASLGTALGVRSVLHPHQLVRNEEGPPSPEEPCSLSSLIFLHLEQDRDLLPQCQPVKLLPARLKTPASGSSGMSSTCWRHVALPEGLMLGWMSTCPHRQRLDRPGAVAPWELVRKAGSHPRQTGCESAFNQGHTHRPPARQWHVHIRLRSCS